MRGLVVSAVLATLALAGACQGRDDRRAATTQPAPAGSGSAGAVPAPRRSTAEQVVPPLDIKNPPPDAVKTATGLIYKKLVSNPDGVAPQRNDTVMLHFTGWSQRTGETFNTTKTRATPQAMPLTNAAPGFAEGLLLLKTGERAVLWIPPAIGYARLPTTGTPETLVYEVQVVAINPAPAIPPDVAGPPESAQTLPSGTRYVVVRPGTGKERPRSFDTVEFDYTGWDAEGRMFESTEVRKRPQSAPPYKQPAALEEILTRMTTGQRMRFWTTTEQMGTSGKSVGAQGLLCYELQLTKITKGRQPPAVPADVAAPPADAKATPKGVRYKLLATGKGGPHPGPTDRVKLNYTGWTSDGRMFESSVVRNEPTEFSLAGGAIRGWAEGLPMMAVGDKARFWIPAELAYKGSPGRPQGMLVFDIELLEVKPDKPKSVGRP